MSVENTNFKVGDRIRYLGNSGSQDYGTIMQDNACDDLGWNLSFNDGVWVKWDSNPVEILQIQAGDIELAYSIQNYSESTVQSCIDFLISQGYTVSLSKN